MIRGVGYREKSTAMGNRTERTGLLASMLMIGAYAMLSFSWLVGNPPFHAADEGWHYLRAVGVSQGQLVGDRALYPLELRSEAQARWVNQASTVIHVPAGLAPDGAGCSAFRPEVPATCVNDIRSPRTPVERVIPFGTYPPLPYLLPGMVVSLGSGPIEALYLSRLVMAISSALLISVAVALSRPPGAEEGYWQTGFVVAMTPMVVFVSSTMSASAIEISAGLAFAAAVVRLGTVDHTPNWVWVASATAGAVLALSRGTGALWIGLLSLVLVGLRGAGGTVRLIRSGKVTSVAASIAVLLAVIANRAWEAQFGPKISFDLAPVWLSLATSAGQVPAQLRQAIGVFGWLDSAMPDLAYTAWSILALVLVFFALLLGTRRQRWVLGGSIVSALAVPVLLVAGVMRHTGFGLQGRHILPLIVVVPLLAGGVADRNRERLGQAFPKALPIWVAVTAGVVLFVAWWANARRHAVGSQGPILFLDKSQWTPPLGWAPSLALLLLGIGALIGASLIGTHFRNRQRDGGKAPG